MSCDNSAINGMNPGMAGFIVAKKRVMELNDSMQQGIVYLLGAGPGDPGLMTVRGRELVEAAEVLVYDALSSAELLNWAPAACERIFVGKRASRHALPQEEINALLVKLGRAGKKVVRLKGGDPYVFGRGGEEADALHEAGVPFEVIPGITSAIAGPAYAGIPVTHRKYCTQFTVFTGHEDVNKKESSLDLKGIAGAQGTKIMLMGMQKLADVCEALRRRATARRHRRPGSAAGSAAAIPGRRPPSSGPPRAFSARLRALSGRCPPRFKRPGWAPLR